jgi:hypothetical protein
MKLIDLLPVLSGLFFLAAFIVYKVYTKRERKEAKYSKPKSYEREQESIFMNEFLNVK